MDKRKVTYGSSPKSAGKTVKKTKSKSATHSKALDIPTAFSVKTTGVYHNNDIRCSEITKDHGRCKNIIVPKTTRCSIHQRRKMPHEDAFFDSTFANVGYGIWIGSVDTANDPTALQTAGIKSVINISGFEPPVHTRKMYQKLGIKYYTLQKSDGTYLGDEPIGGRLGLGEFYQYMDRGVAMTQQAPKPALIHCLTEEHQILTNKGFMFLHEIESNPDILVASFDPETNHLVYETYELVLNKYQTQEMIEMTHNNESRRWSSNSDMYGRNPEDKCIDPSNGVSVIVTKGHDMYVKEGLTNESTKGIYWKSHKVWNGSSSKYVQNEYKKVKAETLLTDSERDCVKLLARAPSGIQIDKSASLPFISQLHLDSDEKINSFLRVYGYWLGDGSLSFRTAKGNNNCITCSPVKEFDKQWIVNELKILELKDYVVYSDQNNRSLFYIHDPNWVSMFHAEYRQNYKMHRKDDLPLCKSAKWMWDWVWNLNKDQACQLLTGLRVADGSEAGKENAIFTSSVRFRDEIIRLALHAGYAASFHLMYEAGAHRGVIAGKDVIANHDNWKVSYNCGAQYAEPNLRSKRDISIVEYTGRTWCVTVPHGFIMARRAHFEPTKGYVTKASKPLIMGNCFAGINRSASLIAAYFIAQYGLSFDQARRMLIEANRKRSIHVLTNRFFVSAMQNYASYLRHKRARMLGRY